MTVALDPQRLEVSDVPAVSPDSLVGLEKLPPIDWATVEFPLFPLLSLLVFGCGAARRRPRTMVSDERCMERTPERTAADQ
jgi:hypothetical protein